MRKVTWGVCLNVGCIPSKALLRFTPLCYSENLGVIAESVFDKVQNSKISCNKLTGGVEGLLKGNKVEIVKGEAYFVDNNNLRVMDEKVHKLTISNTLLSQQVLDQLKF